MCLAVLQCDADIDDRIAFWPLGQRIARAMFDRWNIVSRNSPALYGVFKPEARPKRQWSHLDQNIGKLTRPA